MLVYHSSNQCFTNPDTVHSREALDFGKGFYVTRLKVQAENMPTAFYEPEKMPICMFSNIPQIQN